MAGLLQQLLDAGGSQFGIDVLVAGIQSGDISDSLDVAIGKTKLNKKAGISLVRSLIADGLLAGTIEEYQASGVCKAGIVGTGSRGRSAGPAVFMLNADGKHVYAKLHFQGGGKVSPEQVEFRNKFNALVAEYGTVEVAEATPTTAPKSKK